MRCKVSVWAWLPSAGQLISAVLASSARTETVTYLNTIPASHSNEANASKARTYQTRFDGVTWDQENWRLTTTTLEQGHYQARGSIANGYIGINVAASGPFFELDKPVDGDVINGWPLFTRRQTFATVAGFFDRQPSTNGSNFPWLNQYGDESVISGIPHWSGIILDLGDGINYLDATVDNETISNFTSTFDFKGGILSWGYDWSPVNYSNSFHVEYQLFAHKLNVNQAVVRLAVTPAQDANVTIVNVLDGYSAVRSEFAGNGIDGDALYSSVHPLNIHNVTAYVYATLCPPTDVYVSNRSLVYNKPYVHVNDSSIAESVSANLKAGKTASFTKFVGIASSDAFDDPRSVARKAARNAKQAGYEKLLKSHVREWNSIFPDDSVDNFADPSTGRLPDRDDIIDAAVLAVASPYFILQNTVSDSAQSHLNNTRLADNGVSVGGLGSDSYGGMIFWDADIWMQPGIVASYPESAKAFSNYRVAKYPQALANAQTGYTSSKNRTRISRDAALYPWTSGRYGNCTGTGPCFDYEYHLNGDIGLELINEWVASGDTKRFNETLFPVYDSIATAYADLLTKNGSRWTLTNMTDPDEYANHVDDGAFTMAMIAHTLKSANRFRRLFGKETNETWDEMAKNIQIDRDERYNITLEFASMNGSVNVKQADVVLLPYPLQYTQDYTQEFAVQDLDFYAKKLSTDGPGMTYAIFSIVANEVSPSGCSAYPYARYSYEPYIRAPWYQFSEQMVDEADVNGNTHPAYPFLTGHGGAHQVALFGYLGYRLAADSVLHLHPNLPPQVPHVTYRTFYWYGWPMKAESNHTHTTIRRYNEKKPLATADERFSNTSITVQVGTYANVTNYTLPASGPLVIPNRQIDQVPTDFGDIAQCRPVFSKSPYVKGQFPEAAIDGAASTIWQPKRADVLSSLTVKLSDSDVGKKISAIHLNWDNAPPSFAAVVLHDSAINATAAKNSSKPPSLPDIPNAVVALSSHHINISQPYDPREVDIVRPYSGNMTNVTLDHPVPAKKLATLFVWGSQALSEEERKSGNGKGPTVASFSLINRLS